MATQVAGTSVTPETKGAGLASTLKQKLWRTAEAVGLARVYKLAKYRLRGRGAPPPGHVRFGDLRRLQPFDRDFGYGRGRPIDRYYIERWLSKQGAHIRGSVLEIGERVYTETFGSGVTESHMLHYANPEDATYVDDLTTGESIPDARYDCVILTQTLHLIWDMRAVLETVRRVLKPGGVLLCTSCGISQTSDTEWNSTWYWSLSPRSAPKLFGEVFGDGNVAVDVFGNVLAAIGFLMGMADSELSPRELDFQDVEYPVILGIVARKDAAA